ncbi:hypothetical protein SprV_0100148300 [Sparganum proliferum]
MVKGCFVVVNATVDVDFVQAVVLNKQVADGGVVVVEPVLMLATCATEYSQGGRLDCVPQSTLSVLRGGILVSDGGDWKVQLKAVDASYVFFLISRAKAGRRGAGVAFAMRNDIMRRLSCLSQDIKDRLVSLHLPLRGAKFATIINVYAPPQ